MYSFSIVTVPFVDCFNNHIRLLHIITYVMINFKKTRPSISTDSVRRQKPLFPSFLSTCIYFYFYHYFNCFPSSCLSGHARNRGN